MLRASLSIHQTCRCTVKTGPCAVHLAGLTDGIGRALQVYGPEGLGKLAKGGHPRRLTQVQEVTGNVTRQEAGSATGLMDPTLLQTTTPIVHEATDVSGHHTRCILP